MSKLLKTPEITKGLVSEITITPELPETVKPFEFKVDNHFQFIFEGKTFIDDKPYTRTFHKADKANEYKRPITASYPNFDKYDKIQAPTMSIDGIEYLLVEEKYGNKSVCHLTKNGILWLSYVSKKVVISIVADETSKSWNWVDQFIKGKLGLKTSSTASRKGQATEEI